MGCADFLDFAAVTHCGAVKTINEDSVLAEVGVFVVADGVSGSHCGDRASSTVTRLFAALVGRDDIVADRVAETLERANQEVLALQRREHHDAATTACGAVATYMGEVAYWIMFNLGDSRIYHMSASSGLTQVSVDHSHVQELMDAGLITAEQAASHPNRNVVTRAIGAASLFQPDFWLVPMVQGDRLLLCSDGLLHEAGIEEVEEIVAQHRPPQQTVDNLLDLALDRGARDNVSIIVVDVHMPIQEHAEGGEH